MPQTQMGPPASLSTGAELRQVNNTLPWECPIRRTVAGGFSNEGSIRERSATCSFSHSTNAQTTIVS